MIKIKSCNVCFEGSNSFEHFLCAWRMKEGGNARLGYKMEREKPLHVLCRNLVEYFLCVLSHLCSTFLSSELDGQYPVLLWAGFGHWIQSGAQGLQSTAPSGLVEWGRGQPGPDSAVLEKGHSLAPVWPCWVGGGMTQLQSSPMGEGRMPCTSLARWEESGV